MAEKKSVEELVWQVKRNAFGRLLPVIKALRDVGAAIQDDCAHTDGLITASSIRDWIIEQLDLSLGIPCEEDFSEETEEEIEGEGE